MVENTASGIMKLCCAGKKGLDVAHFDLYMPIEEWKKIDGATLVKVEVKVSGPLPLRG